MKFEKKLVIMVGKGDCKGTASLERNGYGTFVTVSTYNAPNLSSGEYFFGIKTASGTFTRALGSLGRGTIRFKMEDFNMDDCHAFVFENNSLNVVMYGTTSAKKIWEGNLLDGIRRENFEQKQAASNIKAENAESALPNYSARQAKVEGAGSLFWDIVPPIGGYIDDTIAEVNYYPSNLTFSKAGEVQEQVAATLCNSSAVTAEQQKAKINTLKRVLPSDMERQYLFRYRNANNVVPASTLQNEPIKTNQTEVIAEKLEKAIDPPPIKIASEQVKKSSAEEQSKTIPPPSAYSAQDAVKTVRTKTRFYERAAKQIDELFRTNPRHEQLEKLMPSTKWVKVDYNNSGKFYVVGIIGSTPDYLCYGVPAMYTTAPPIELEGYSAFVPLDPSKPQSNGFWLMYQDATTGAAVTKPTHP